MTSYLTIGDVENILYKDKASKFIGFAYAVKDETDIKEKLERLRSLHPKATHHCYAYRLGTDKNNYRTNDDGEPGGSAGKPILGQIDSMGVTNCLVVVVRYFGGTKLGVPGLIAAYKDTAKETLEASPVVEHKILDYYKIICAYENINKIYQIIHHLKASVVNQQLDNRSQFIIAAEQDKSESLKSKLTDEQIEFAFLERK